MIGDDMLLARHLHQLMADHPSFEAMTHGLSITTFRYVPPELKAQFNHGGRCAGRIGGGQHVRIEDRALLVVRGLGLEHGVRSTGLLVLASPLADVGGWHESRRMRRIASGPCRVDHVARVRCQMIGGKRLQEGPGLAGRWRGVKLDAVRLSSRDSSASGGEDSQQRCQRDDANEARTHLMALPHSWPV